MASSSITAQYQIAEQMVSIVGADHTRVESEGTVTVAPTSTEQVSQVLAFCYENNLSVRPLGGGTKQRWGNGSAPNVNLSLARLNQIIEHPWHDLTCTVQAGCTWGVLQDTLRAHGQFVALDPLFEDRATIGGILATNDSGALRHRYGSLRDLVIGMTLVLADGTIARTGGKVVKNVAGYDLCKLLTGSLGTLAIITQANFRLHPLPQHERHFTISAPSAKQLSSLLAKIRESHLLVSSLQLRSTRDACYLDVLLTAHPLSHQDAILDTMVRAEGLTLGESSSEVWRAREALFSAQGATVLRISTLPEQVCAYIDGLRASFPQLSIFSVSQSIGLHTVAIEADTQQVSNLLQQLRDQAQSSRANVTVLEPGPLSGAAFVIPQAELALMRAIKHQFDPNNILNPGKMF
jgi:glycolate oxidase FAD binding subunit